MIFLYLTLIFNFDLFPRTKTMSHPPPSAQRHPTRPAIQQRSESLLPPHESNSITSIPVTPGISQGTYGKCPSGVPTSRHPHAARQGYFSSQLDPVNEAQPQPSPASPLCARLPLISRLSQLQLGDVALSGTVLSATFPLPQSIQYRKEGTWVGSHLEKKLRYIRR